jgi:glycosyltransferase involved in cell wall biosynthesis
LPNPIDLTGETNLDAPREKRVLFVGRLSYWDKRIDRLLDVWRLVHNDFPDWRLTIAGEGEELHDLQRIVRKHNLPRVEFLGFVADPTALYASSEILCLTSSIEGCPMVLLEAQLHGCAAIAFDCCSGVREILSPNGECGLFVPNGDIEAYAKALSQLMGNEELRLSIRRNGLESVTRFAPERSAEQYHNLIVRLTRLSYQRLINQLKK